MFRFCCFYCCHWYAVRIVWAPTMFVGIHAWMVVYASHKNNIHTNRQKSSAKHCVGTGIFKILCVCSLLNCGSIYLYIYEYILKQCTHKHIITCNMSKCENSASTSNIPYETNRNGVPMFRVAVSRQRQRQRLWWKQMKNTKKQQHHGTTTRKPRIRKMGSTILNVLSLPDEANTGKIMKQNDDLKCQEFEYWIILSPIQLTLFAAAISFSFLSLSLALAGNILFTVCLSKSKRTRAYTHATSSAIDAKRKRRS